MGLDWEGYRYDWGRLQETREGVEVDLQIDSIGFFCLQNIISGNYLISCLLDKMQVSRTFFAPPPPLCRDPDCLSYMHPHFHGINILSDDGPRSPENQEQIKSYRHCYESTTLFKIILLRDPFLTTVWTHTNLLPNVDPNFLLIILILIFQTIILNIINQITKS